MTDPLAVVVITTFDLDEYVHGALKAGARAVPAQDAGPDLLAQAVRAAANGDALMRAGASPHASLSTFSGLGDSARSRHNRSPRSPSERRGAGHRRPGRTNAEIADVLCISLSTVKTHLASLMNKLGARNRVELAMWAYEDRPRAEVDPACAGPDHRPNAAEVRGLDVVPAVSMKGVSCRRRPGRRGLHDRAGPCRRRQPADPLAELGASNRGDLVHHHVADFPDPIRVVGSHR